MERSDAGWLVCVVAATLWAIISIATQRFSEFGSSINIWLAASVIILALAKE